MAACTQTVKEREWEVASSYGLDHILDHVKEEEGDAGPRNGTIIVSVCGLLQELLLV